MSQDSKLDRLKLFQEHTALTNNAFATKCGINPSNYSKMVKGDLSFTQRSIALIGDAFPELNTIWLLTGEGEMLRKDYIRDEIALPSAEELDKLYDDMRAGRVSYVPLIHIDSVGGIHSQNLMTPSEQYVERMIPFLDARPGDVAIIQSGNSMAPTIPAGAIIQIRRVAGWKEYFGYGNDFVLWLNDDRRITKQVLRFEPDPQNFITCHSYNPEAGDEELPKSMIKEVWKVVNVLINKGW